MPMSWDAIEDQQNGSSEFLKLEDGDSVLAQLAGAPMVVRKHTLDDGSDYGKRFFCGEREGLGCPICEDPSQFKLKDDRLKQEAFYPLWVESRMVDGKNEPVKAQMILAGGWSVIGAIKAAKEAQEADGDEITGVPLRITREGVKAQTRYSVIPKPKLAVTPEGEPCDVEGIAWKMIEKDQESVGYMREDSFAGHPGDPPATNGNGAKAEPAADDTFSLRDRYTTLAKEAGFRDKATLDAYLKSQNVAIHSAQDLPAAIDALQRRLAKLAVGDEEGEDLFDWEGGETEAVIV